MGLLFRPPKPSIDHGLRMKQLLNTNRLPLYLVALVALLVAGLWASIALVLASPESRPPAVSLYQGPAQGTSSGGATRDTASFAAAALAFGERAGGTRVAPIGRIDRIQLPGSAEVRSDGAPSLLEVMDGGASTSAGVQAIPAPELLQSFQGLTDTGDAFRFIHIPPDPIMAAGPNHVMGLVNTSFGIFTKSGTMQKLIDATVWFQNVLPGKIGHCVDTPLGCVFDPKVVYDHFADRWVMVWLATDKVTESWILVSVSDDADPNGVWCNWALDGDLNGTTPASNWSDYQGLGYDDQAVYVVPNQFAFAGGFDYAKIRILPKSTLYNASCPAITWTDLWDVRFPEAGADQFAAATLRPAVTFGAPGVEYLMANSFFFPPNNDFMVLYSLTNPLATSPTLTAQTVTVAATIPPPDANQKDGSAGVSGCAAPCLIDVGGHRIRNVVYRDGSVWTAHSVAGGAQDEIALARYVRIGVGGPTLLEDEALGLPNCWNYYPAVTVDAGGNMAMVFNRSCSNTASVPEYAGIRYTYRRPSDAGLQPSTQLKSGEANYVKTFGGSRNRWGDYSGVAVDPADGSIWMFAEYAAAPIDKWGTWFGKLRFPVALTAPILVSPADNALLATSTPAFDWQPSSGDVLDYRLQVVASGDDVTAGPFTLDLAISGDTTQFQTTGDLADGTYAWRVVTRDTSLNTAASVTRTFIVDVDTPQSGTLTVTKTGDTDDGFCGLLDCSLREAIGSGDSGDSITFAVTGTITLVGSQLVIDKSLRIDGPGSGDLSISGNNVSRVFQISKGNVSISGLTIRDGNISGNSGGGIHNSSTLTLTNSTISANTAGGGDAPGGGGIFNARGGALTLTNTTVSGNATGVSDGGGIWSNGTLTIINSIVSGNTGIGGGGILNSGTADLTNSTVSGNSAGSSGGGIFNQGTLVLTNSTVSGNSTGKGGGIWSNGTLTITNSTITGNTASSWGGGIKNDGGTLTLTSSTVSSNSSFRGGGVYNSSGAELKVMASTIDNNNAAGDGGGIFGAGGGTIKLTNSTLSGNSAATGGGGVDNAGSLTLVNTTISANTSPGSFGGGGVYNNVPITLVNTIIAANTASPGPDCSGPGAFTSLGHNLIGTSDGCSFTPATGDLVNVGPLLGPLQDNGGPTFTHALLPGSPAIDSGDAAVLGTPLFLTTDQRGEGFPRLQGAHVDIGAYEAASVNIPQSGTLTVTKTGDTNDGFCGVLDCSLREAIAASASGDHIVIPGGTYTLVSTLGIDKSLALIGAGADSTIIQAHSDPGASTFRVFIITQPGDVSMSGVTIQHGKVTGESFGGGIYNNTADASLSLTNTKVTRNSATLDGGGVFSFGPLTVIDSTMSHNTADGRGGGIAHIFGLTMTNSTVSDNFSTDSGGGIFSSSGPATFTNSTISGNTAGGDGGGIGNFGTATVTNSTISSNSASTQGGGIYNNGTLTLTNTIIAGNSGSPGPDCTGPVTSLGHNLIGTSDGCSFTPATGDLVNVDPLLGPLQDNGRPTFTHALLPGSPAIDAGDDVACPVTDQRGVARPVDGDGDGAATCDIGAFEASNPVDLNGDGVVNGADLRIVAAALGASGIGDVNGDGTVDGLDLAVVGVNFRRP